MHDPANTLSICDPGRERSVGAMFDLKRESCSGGEGEERETEGGEPALSASISRCANVSSADLDELEHNRNESSTVKQTVWAVNCFKAWLREKRRTLDFHTAEKSELNPVLREFYGSIRTSKGELYGISSYVGLRAGLNRFINEPPLSRGWNLMQDPDFRAANNVFKGVVKQMRRSGRDITAHYPPISAEDQHLLKHSCALDPASPRGLLNKVWYDIQLHFGLRGKEGNRHLQPDAFALNRDPSGFKFFTMTVNEDAKSPPDRDRDRKKRKAMFEEPGDPLCPVASLEKYLRKIPADAAALYLQPKRVCAAGDGLWYTALPLGVNYLSQMLPKICKEAGTRTTYTNHSLRVTSIQRLSESREIMPGCLTSSPVEMSSQWQQESAPYSPSSELDSSYKQESPMSSHSWVKQEPEPEVIQWENKNSEAATNAEQDKSLSSAVATAESSMEGLPSSAVLTITKLQCLLESKQERIEALERQVQDLQEDRRFLRSQIENLTGARLVPVPEVPTASTSMFSEPGSRKRRRKSSSSITDQSSRTSSSEESISARKKRRHKKKGKRESPHPPSGVPDDTPETRDRGTGSGVTGRSPHGCVKMPLSNNEKSARHRAKVNADPVARASYLAKRRESYQRRKREGKTRHPAVSELSKERQAELRFKWRHYQRSHRNKVRNLPLQSCSPVEMSSQWLQDFAPYSPSSELDSSSARQESPVSNYSWMKQEPETEIIQWENMSSLPAPNHTEQDNSAASTVTPPSMEGLPSSAVLTITKLQCLLESKQERIEALERQVQDLQEDRRFLRSQIENLTSALSTHVCRVVSGESTGKS